MRTITITPLLILCAGTMCTCTAMGKTRQKRAWIIDSFNIEEEKSGPFPYVLGRIELDRSYMVDFELYGQGVDKEPKNILKIDKNTGVISVYGKVDYEVMDSSKTLKLLFEAKNRSNNAVDTRLGVEIKVLDINDHAPVFQPSSYEVTLQESHSQGKEIVTVLASDKDDSKTPNGTFSFTIKSVTPVTDNVEFYIQQREDSGTLYHRGCMEYEKAQKYTVVVEAKDHGKKIQLSSTTTVTINISDQNNHLPEFSGKTGPGKVKERDTEVEVLRLQVTDKDSPGSPAWKAKYTIYGDTKKSFQIATDPNTNEGILTIVKPLDYEEQTFQNVSISVQNEIPYYSCTIKKRTPNAMWDLDKFFEPLGTSLPNLYKSIPVTINVEDVNDPPIFIPPLKEVVVMENTNKGKFLTTFTAKDLDGSHGNTFKYVKGEDVADWITIDPVTGQVSSTKILDRESPFVMNNTYRATVYAVDNGVPPLTGTGTLLIYLNDQNDNIPVMEVTDFNLCLSDEPTMVNIKAVDLDLPPYTSPFYYELLGDVKDKWRIEPAYGTTVSLIKENNVYSGQHTLQVRISDQQGFYSIQNLSVTVCDCTIVPTCHVRRVSSSRIGAGAGLVIVFTVLALLAILLMTLLLSCKPENKMIMMDEGIGRLITMNTENPGTDCMVPSSVGQKADAYQEQNTKSFKASTIVKSKHQSTQQTLEYKGQQAVAQTPGYTEQTFTRSIQRNSTRPSYRGIQNFQRSSFRSSVYNASTPYLRETISSLINQKLIALQTHCDEFGVFDPHNYANEGEFVANTELDAISIPEDDFQPEMLRNLDSKFTELALISRPDLMAR